MSLVMSEHSLTKDYKQEMLTTTCFCLSQHPALVTMEAFPAPIRCKLCACCCLFKGSLPFLIQRTTEIEEKKQSTPQNVFSKTHGFNL